MAYCKSITFICQSGLHLKTQCHFSIMLAFRVGGVSYVYLWWRSFSHWSEIDRGLPHDRSYSCFLVPRLGKRTGTTDSYIPEMERLLEDLEFLGIVKLPSTASMFTRILTEKRPSGWAKTPSSAMFETLDPLQSRTEMSGFGIHPLDLHNTKSWLAAVLQTRKLTSDPWTTNKQ